MTPVIKVPLTHITFEMLKGLVREAKGKWAKVTPFQVSLYGVLDGVPADRWRGLRVADSAGEECTIWRYERSKVGTWKRNY